VKPTRRFPFLIAGAVACVAVAQQAAPPDEEDVPEVEEEWDFTKDRGHDLTMIDRLVPPGQSHSGLRYPVYSEPKDGTAPVLKSQFESKVVTRLDATHLRFQGAVVSVFDDARYPDMATRMISLAGAIYDLQHEILFSNDPVQILDRDLTVRGGAVLHDPVSGITVLSDGVELYFNEPPRPAPAAATPPVTEPKKPEPPSPGQ
jgi:hypothetical protein